MQVICSGAFDISGHSFDVGWSRVSRTERQTGAAAEIKPAVEPKAVELLKAAGSRLPASPRICSGCAVATAVVTYESYDKTDYPSRLHNEVR